MRSDNRNAILPGAAVLLCAFMLAAPLQAQTEPPPSISFTAAAVAADDAWTETTTAGSTVDMSVFDSYRQTHTETLTVNSNVTKTKRVVAAGPSGIDVLDVAYAAAQANAVPMPVVGKSYRVSMQGQSMQVAYADGTAVPSAAEVAFVQGDNPQMDQFWTFNKIFGGQTVAVGGVVTVQKAFAEEFVNAQDGMVVDLLQLTLREITGEGAARQAVFDAVLAMHDVIKSNEKSADETKGKTKFSGRIDIAMTGEVVVAPNCRPLKVAFSGTNRVTAKKGAFDPGELPPAQEEAAKGKEMRVGGAEGTMSFATTFAY